MRNITMIVNPLAGKGRAAALWPHVAAALRSAAVEVRVEATGAPGDATRFAARAANDGSELIVAVGGDGTINEVVNGLMSAEDPGRRPPLMIVPAGTCNDVARGLKLGNWSGSLADLEDARAVPVDVARVQHVDPRGEAAARYFVNVADLGLGGRAVMEAARRRRLLGGTLSFLYGALVSVWCAENPRVAVLVDGQPLLEGRSCFVVIANGRYFAGGMHVAPQADPSDGLLDVLALRATPRWRLTLDLLPRVYLGAHLGHPRVAVSRGRHVTVRGSARLPLEVDGELVGSSDAELSILPGAITVLVPRRTLRAAR